MSRDTSDQSRSRVKDQKQDLDLDQDLIFRSRARSRHNETISDCKRCKTKVNKLSCKPWLDCRSWTI